MDYKFFELLQPKLDFKIEKQSYCFNMIPHDYLYDEGFRMCVECGLTERYTTETGYNRYFTKRVDKNIRDDTECNELMEKFKLNYKDSIKIFEKYRDYCSLDFIGLPLKKPKIFRGRNRVFLIRILIFKYLKNV